ncbi:hypothetical protein [Planomonospora alba]|uniref:hypothetical protein n=1 Tax=Planomonospora alba TaxID=161354 RepID=UPI0031EA5608
MSVSPDVGFVPRYLNGIVPMGLFFEYYRAADREAALIADADPSTELVTTTTVYPSYPYPSPAPQSDEEWGALRRTRPT